MFRHIFLLLCGAMLALAASGCVSNDLPNTPEISALRVGAIPIGSRFGDPYGVDRSLERRREPHKGIDILGKIGDPVPAAAGGIVHAVINVRKCSRGVVLYHPQYSVYTLYCHLSKYAEIYLGDIVQRGEVIGYLGMIGETKGVPHVHFEVRRTPQLLDDSYMDPMRFLVGCFDRTKNYRSVDTGGVPLLTAPVACGSEIPVMETRN